MDAPAPLTAVEKAAFLIDVDLFRDVPSEALSELAARMDEGSHAPGDVLLEPDSPDVRLWVVVAGRVRLAHSTEAPDELGRADAFGLLASLGLPQEATVTAIDECRTLSIAPDEYLDVLADSTAFALANLRALGRRLRGCERERGVRTPEPRPPGGGDTR